MLSNSSKSVLFIGNSYTAMNNFSLMVSDIALENGDTLFTDFAAIDSYTLEKHYSNKATLNKIKEKKWDFIVLQEQSQRPILDINSFNNQTLSYTEKFLQVIYNNNATTRPLLFLTWGRKYGDTSLCSKYSYACNYVEMQDKLTERYFLLGEKMGVDVVPCGIAWKYIMAGDDLSLFTKPTDDIELFYPDNSHPSEVGSFLNALVFYCVLTGKDAIHCRYNPADISDEALIYLQCIAAEVVKYYYFSQK